jgi:hypothetical protein
MIATEQVYIPLKKAKLARLMRVSIINILFGLWLVSRVGVNQSLFMMLASSFGFILVLFFIPLTYLVLKKWKDKRAGIIVDCTGITDNTYLFSAVHIPWSDIQDIRKTKRTLLVIFIDNPVAYIGMQPGFFKRKVLSMAFKYYGSPIIMNSVELKIAFNKLQSILHTELTENRSLVLPGFPF